MDLNHRPLPYQGSALTELSYTPSYPRNASTPERVPQLRPDGEPAGEALLRFPQRYLDPADEVRREVVHHRADRGEGGDQEHVEHAEECRVTEDRRRGEPVRDVHAVGALARGDVRERLLDRVEYTETGQRAIEQRHRDEQDDEASQ